MDLKSQLQNALNQLDRESNSKEIAKRSLQNRRQKILAPAKVKEFEGDRKNKHAQTYI